MWLAKPKALAVTSYEPTGSTMLYWPFASVVTVRFVGPAAWTVAPTIGPPPPETVPCNVPVGPRGA